MRLKRCILFFFVLSLCGSSLFAKPPQKKFQCKIYDLPLPRLPNGEVAYVNGMNHKPERAIHCAEILSDLAGGFNIFVVYNPTGGFFKDIAKCFVELFHFRNTEPVHKLHQKWDHFFSTHGPNAKLLQFCHSQGSIQVRNALLRYPPSCRERIVVIAIAPAAYIPDFICCEAFHYASRRDIVPHLDGKGKKLCKEKIVTLTPHPEAAFFDHHFLSPTFHPAIRHHLKVYLEKECQIPIAHNSSIALSMANSEDLTEQTVEPSVIAADQRPLPKQKSMRRSCLKRQRAIAPITKVPDACRSLSIS